MSYRRNTALVYTDKE